MFLLLLSLSISNLYLSSRFSKQNQAIHRFNFGWQLCRGKDNRNPSLARPKGAKWRWPVDRGFICTFDNNFRTLISGC